MPVQEPSDEDLLAIAKEAIKIPLDERYKANVDQTAQALINGTSPGGERWVLTLAKMLLMASHKMRVTEADPQI